MMNLPDYIPNIHPLIIHFPIVLIPLGFVVHLICVFLKRMDEFRFPIGLLYLAATASSSAAFLSGRQAADTVSVLAQANLVLSEHADLALWTLSISVTVTLLYGLWLRSKDLSFLPWVVLALSLVNIGFLVVTADHGGQLVYRFGTGVSLPKEKPAIPQKNEQVSAITTNPDGSWKWESQLENSQNNFSEFYFIDGNSDDIQSDSKKNGLFSIIKPLSFVLKKTVADLQVEVKLDLSEFNGDVSILHHYQSMEHYDFLEISSGKIILGRVENGKRNEMDSKNLQVDGWITLKAIGSGRHFKGYLDEKLVVHGHAPAFDSGSVGLWVNGTGTLGLISIETIILKHN
tara:strand:+ start:513 stop:1547 length:1035 start_codon:yes stop_codon:yes gene_type:complete